MLRSERVGSMPEILRDGECVRTMPGNATVVWIWINYGERGEIGDRR